MTQTAPGPLDVLARFRELAARAGTDEEAKVIADRARDWVRRSKAAKWEPYPWQHPHVHPPGWVSTRAPGVCDEGCYALPTVQIPAQGTWLEYGGRGTGKTEGAAHYVNAHVEGPPCDTRLRGGHKLLIIGPTQGDAIDAAVTGVSGLETINPAVRHVTRLGGTFVLWPNGARARILGASGEEDIKSLRASGNNSLPIGTLIRTEYGPRPIEGVHVGDRVWTHVGLRPVIREWDHGMKPVVTLTTAEGRTLRLTADHEVWTTQGWVDAADLPVGARIIAWSTTVTAGSASAPTAPAPSRSPDAPLPSSSTATSTRSTTGPSLTDGTFTTWTTTRPITTRPTFAHCLLGNTAPSTHQTPNGTARAGWPRSAGQPSGSAHNAGPSSGEESPNGGSALDSAGDSTSVPLPPVGCSHASCVAAISTHPAGLPPSLALDSVETVTHGSTAVRVLDLTVAGEHAFFADDLLVANCLIYLEEAAAMRRLSDVITIAAFGLRTGPNAHWVIATTPKNRPEMKAISADPATVVTRGRTKDAHRLNPADREAWEAKYGGTTLGRQELDAEELADVEGALWVTERPLTVDGAPNADQRPGIANDRLPAGSVAWVPHTRPTTRDGVVGLPPVLALPPPAPVVTCTETIIGIDPAGGRTENGLVVVGLAGQHAYVLADLTLTGPPDTWARVALAAYYDYGCTGLAAETTYGGDQVPSVIRLLCESLGIPVPPIFRMPTKVGKKLRAEPVVALYQQHRTHHVGVLPLLEAEQTTWVPGETAESPNRVDALVHAETFLLIARGQAEISNPARPGLPSIGSTSGR